MRLTVFHPVFFAACFIGAHLGAANVVVCFRCDDIYAQPTDNSHRIETYRKILRTFHEVEAPLTIGVVPNYRGTHPLTSGNPVAVMLRQAVKNDLFDVALHGFTHEQVGGASEWLGVAFEEQQDRLRKGLTILQGALGSHEPNTFLPPWNSFDLNTLHVLSTHGFTLLSGDVGRVRGRPFHFRKEKELRYFDIALLPATCSLKELPTALELAKRDPGATIVVVIFHPYDFREYDPPRGSLSISDLRHMLTNVKRDEDVSLYRLQDVPRESLTPERYAAASRYAIEMRIMERLLPRITLVWAGLTDGGVGHWFYGGRYRSAEAYRRLEARCLAILILLGGIPTLVGSAAIGHVLRGRLSRRMLAVAAAVIWLICTLLAEWFGLLVTAPSMRGLLGACFCLLLLTEIGLLWGARPRGVPVCTT